METLKNIIASYFLFVLTTLAEGNVIGIIAFAIVSDFLAEELIGLVDNLIEVYYDYH